MYQEDQKLQPGKPHLIKALNKSLIYQVLESQKSATRNEISQTTKISLTTVRSILQELVEQGEVIEARMDESSGGRPAIRYALNANASVAVFILCQKSAVHWQIGDSNGNILAYDSYPIKSKDSFLVLLFDLLNGIMEEWSIKNIALAISPLYTDWENHVFSDQMTYNMYYLSNRELENKIRQLCQIPTKVIFDIHSLAVGCANRYIQDNGLKNFAQTNLLYWLISPQENALVNIVKGKIIEDFPYSLYYNQILFKDFSFLQSETSKSSSLTQNQKRAGEKKIMEYICQLIIAFNSVTKADIVVLDATFLENAGYDIFEIKKRLKQILPKNILPEIVFTKVVERDYFDGLIYSLQTKIDSPFLSLQ